jgi:Secretion system C-terminal sorting domain
MMKLRLQKSKSLQNILTFILLIGTLSMPFEIKADNVKENKSLNSATITAVTKTWIGGTGNWNVKANWSPAGVPTDKDVVEIPAKNAALVNCVVTVPKGFWAKAEELILNGGSLTLNGASRLSINGSIEDGFVVTQGSLFLNKGTLEVDNVALNAISTLGSTGTSTFTNEGTIRIGSRGIIGAQGIRLMKTTFTNTIAGRIFIDNTFDVDQNGETGFALILTAASVFHNEGEITLGGTNSVAHGIDSPIDFINDGILTFTNVDKDGVSAQTTIINNGTIDVSVGSVVEVKGTINNLGFMTLDGKIIIDQSIDPVSLNIIKGAINNSGFITVFPDGSIIDKGVFTSEASIRNYGLISIAKSEIFDMTGTAFLYNESTGIVNVEGQVNIALGGEFNSFGTTQGDWNILKNGAFNSEINSRIAPGTGLNLPAGNGVGLLTANGSLDLMAGMLDIEAQGATAPLYDVLKITGSVTITPDSKLSLMYGEHNGTMYAPADKDEITVIKSTTPVTGRFAASNILLPSSGWVVKYDYPAVGDVTLTYDILLPVELLSFKATNKGATNLLTWETASEILNKGFEVQRKNEQGEWDILGFVKGNGKPSVYNFTDNDPLSISYYRLRQVDHDGNSELSKIVSVTKLRKLEVQVYPNPTYGKVTVQLTKEADAAITVYNMIGQTVITNVHMTTVGEVDLSGLTRGTYIVEIKSEGAISRMKVVKQ